MTQEQWMVLLRDVLKIGGTVAGMLGVAQGSIDQWSNLILTVGGPLVAVLAVLWAQMRHTPSGIVSQASRLDEVKEMTVTKPDLARAAKEADPRTDVRVQPVSTKPAF